MRKVLIVGVASALLLGCAGTAYAHDYDRDRDHSDNRHWDDEWSWDDGDDRWDGRDDSSDGDAGSGVVIDGEARTISAELTGYSWQDNSPPGSAEICCAVIHDQADGQGTFADPITTAVPGSGSSMETKAGTRLYIEKLRRYFIVEDSGATSTGKTRFDLWVGGQGFSRSDSDACMDELTGDATVILNPADGLPVTAGELTTSNGCKI